MENFKVQVLKSVYLESPKGWALHNSITLYFTEAEYYRFIADDTLNWFRRLGSKQVVQRSETSFGRQVTKLSSFAPDNSEKHVYNFRFIH